MVLNVSQTVPTKQIDKKMPARLTGCQNDRTRAKTRPPSATIAIRSARKYWRCLRATVVLRAGATPDHAFDDDVKLRAARHPAV